MRENLEYSAWLRNPKYMRTRAKHDLVDDVIDLLNLRSVQHSVVGTAEKRGIRQVIHTLPVCLSGTVPACLPVCLSARLPARLPACS